MGDETSDMRTSKNEKYYLSPVEDPE
jgi:hypothetical protein